MDERRGDEEGSQMKGFPAAESSCDMTNGSDENNGSNSSNSGGSGNNSDNSALVSLGNTSFGFNFDSEEGHMNNGSSPNNSETGDAGRNRGPRMAKLQRSAAAASGPQAKATAAARPNPNKTTPSAAATAAAVVGPSVDENSEGNGNDNDEGVTDSEANMNDASHEEAAAAAVANLKSIAAANNVDASANANAGADNDVGSDIAGSLNQKRKNENVDDDSGGYNTDDEGGRAMQTSMPKGGKAAGFSNQVTSGESTHASDQGQNQKGSRKKKRLDDYKREERNAREKERSFRISRQINELRGLLSSGGVIVPKGTKSSVLTEAANYIRMLQQHQYRSEIDRHQLVQQIQMIGGGALGQPAASAVRHVAAQNGVWSLGNFGGVPPKSAMMYHQPASCTSGETDPQAEAATESQAPSPADNSVLQSKIETRDYRYVFNSCTVGMAIASMGGAFIDCNRLFCHLSDYSKQEVCSMTIFNLTSRQDLQHAFDLISQMLSAPTETTPISSGQPCVLRGAMKNRIDLGLNVSLIKGEDGVAKCFCVTLIQNPEGPFDGTSTIPATANLIQTSTRGDQTTKDGVSGTMESTPAYTAG